MGSRWGDDIDEELKINKKIKVGFVFNVQQMLRLLESIEEETREWDNKYPKSELIKIGACCHFFIFLAMMLSHQILIVATGLFFLLYLFVLWRIIKVWKRFKYPVWQYLLLNLAGFAVSLGLGYLCQYAIFVGFK